MKQKPFGITMLFATALALTAATAQAQPGQLYFGVAAGPTSLDTRITTVTTQLDESSTGFKLYGGYHVSRNVAVEFEYADLGEAKLTGNAGDQFVRQGVLYQFLYNNAELKFSPTLIGVSGVFSQRITPALDVHGRVGLASWNVDISSRASGVSLGSTSESGTDIFYGLGAGFWFAPQWRVTLDYENYTVYDGDSSLFSVGIAKDF